MDKVAETAPQASDVVNAELGGGAH
jgi:hypothetical protein